MRIISFDVGMKNLAYCIFSIPNTIAFTGSSPYDIIHHIQIERWDVIDLRFPPNLSETANEDENKPPKRMCINDTKLAKWMFNTTSSDTSVAPVIYCAKCAERSKYKIPSREILPIKRNPDILIKKKLGELMDIKENLSECHGQISASAATPQNLKLRKADLIQEIKTTLARDYLEPFDETRYASYLSGNILTSIKPKKVNYTYAHDLDLITYGYNMMKHLDLILYSPSPSPSSLSIDMMIIENQISTLASRMKTLQGMITQYFIMKHIPKIEFISASCKLKLFTDTNMEHVGGEGELCVDASTYADRKKSGIFVCRSLGEISQQHNSDFSKWMPAFEKHKKKDDLADCFLQGLWRVHSAV